MLRRKGQEKGKKSFLKKGDKTVARHGDTGENKGKKGGKACSCLAAKGRCFAKCPSGTRKKEEREGGLFSVTGAGPAGSRFRSPEREEKKRRKKKKEKGSRSLLGEKQASREATEEKTPPEKARNVLYCEEKKGGGKNGLWLLTALRRGKGKNLLPTRLSRQVGKKDISGVPRREEGLRPPQKKLQKGEEENLFFLTQPNLVMWAYGRRGVGNCKREGGKGDFANFCHRRGALPGVEKREKKRRGAFFLGNGRGEL